MALKAVDFISRATSEKNSECDPDCMVCRTAKQITENILNLTQTTLNSHLLRKKSIKYVRPFLG